MPTPIGKRKRKGKEEEGKNTSTAPCRKKKYNSK